MNYLWSKIDEKDGYLKLLNLTFYDLMYNCVSDAFGDVTGQRKLIQSVNFLQHTV